MWREEDHPRDKDGKFAKTDSRQKLLEVLKKRGGQKTQDKTDSQDGYTKPAPKEFKVALIKAKQTVPPEERWRVDDTYTKEDYGNAKLFKTNGGSVVAVKSDGDIVSVCKNQNDKEHYGSNLLKKAIENGGNKLDAFGEDLYNFYTKNGFEPVSWTEFNREYAPHDWKPEYGEEPVIFYKHTGKRTQESYEDFLKRVKPQKDYEEAKNARDKEIE